MFDALADRTTLSTEWGFRDDRDGGFTGPIPEEQAREVVAELDDVTLVCRTVRVSEWEAAS